MSIRTAAFVQGSYYHIYNRGNSKQKIFKDENDYYRFLKLLFISNSQENFKSRDFDNKDIYNSNNRGERLASIGAYCLMPNHFHLLITPTENGSVSKFMQKLSTAYSMYFNTRYERTGTLFEGKFKSQLADNDNYLKYLFSYIHLNPIKLIDPTWRESGIRDTEKSLRFLDQYPFSSFTEYSGNERAEKVILNRNEFPQYFPSKDSFNKEIIDWITFTQARPV